MNLIITVAAVGKLYTVIIVLNTRSDDIALDMSGKENKLILISDGIKAAASVSRNLVAHDSISACLRLNREIKPVSCMIYTLAALLKLFTLKADTTAGYRCTAVKHGSSHLDIYIDIINYRSKYQILVIAL